MHRYPLHTDIKGYRDTKIQRYRDTEIQSYRDTDIQRYSKTEIQTYRHTDIQTYRDTSIQTYRHTDTQAYRQAEIQRYSDTEIQTHTQVCGNKKWGSAMIRKSGIGTRIGIYIWRYVMIDRFIDRDGHVCTCIDRALYTVILIH